MPQLLAGLFISLSLSLGRTGTKLGITPLMLAAMNGHTVTVKLLLDMGSDINAQVKKCPLFLCSYLGMFGSALIFSKAKNVTPPI